MHLPETPRLYFREFKLADAGLLLDMHQDPAITRYTGDPFPWVSIEGTEKILSEVILPQYKNKIGRWAVHLKSDHTFIGWCGLKDIGEAVDLGYRFIQRYWRQGYATEAAKAVLAYGMQMGLKGIVGRSDAENTGSIKVLEGIGMVYSHHIVEDGRDCICFVPATEEL